MLKSVKSNSDILKDTLNYNTIYLHPGEVFYTNKPAIVHTILGSCVSVIIYHEPLKLSLISHAQLPYRKNKSGNCFDACPTRCLNDAPDDCDNKYVDCSFAYMMDIIKKYNIPKNKLYVKIFGGANVLPTKHKQKTIGEQNIETALNLVEHHNLKLVSKNIGGDTGRKLYLYTESGDVYVNNLNQVNQLD